MKIRDIVNRDIVNLNNCEQEPIHIPGSIQPHGFLVAMSTEKFLIEFCSENTGIYTGVNYKNILGKTFAQVFGDEAAQALQKHFIGEVLLPTSMFPLNIFNKNFLCTIHKSGEQLILEAESTSNTEILPDIYSQTRQFLFYMEESSGLQQLCQRVAENTRDITGYDRVMIYRFDDEYNGEVFAESKRDDLEPFLGLHYPHTDIPPQARQLYLKNLVRLIVDIGYEAVPLYTIDDRADKNLDLSLSILRSVSPIHVQYLQNMGVGATLTVSLIHKGKLWGLIACHHYSPKNLLPEVKIASQLQGHFITSQIDTRQLNEEYDLTKKCNQALERLLSQTNPLDYSSFNLIAENPNLLALCNAAGVAIIVNNKIYKGGNAPDNERVKEIAACFNSQNPNSIAHTAHLGTIFPATDESIAGVVYHALTNDHSSSIIWFRPESIAEMNWAGDPAKAIVKDEKGLSPRNSFKLWKEIVKGRSIEWKHPELNAALQYSSALQKQVNLLAISEEERKYRELSELLKQTNAELENINWISTHDLQEPLRKIQLFASLLLEDTGEKTLDENRPVIEKINNSANRMAVLLKDILKYTKVKNAKVVLEKVNLNQLIDEILPEIKESAGKRPDIIVEALPEVYAIPFLQKQVFSNLIYNSIKFADIERSPEISISNVGIRKHPDQHSDQDYHVIRHSDNGIGFDPKYSDTIFNVFTRLHNYQEYEGSGIGLALCKKIMQTQNGLILAEGMPGKGANFYLYFPVQKNIQYQNQT